LMANQLPWLLHSHSAAFNLAKMSLFTPPIL
jgi:hypothetical protein